MILIIKPDCSSFVDHIYNHYLPPSAIVSRRRRWMRRSKKTSIYLPSAIHMGKKSGSKCVIRRKIKSWPGKVSLKRADA